MSDYVTDSARRLVDLLSRSRPNGQEECVAHVHEVVAFLEQFKREVLQEAQTQVDCLRNDLNGENE